MIAVAGGRRVAVRRSGDGCSESVSVVMTPPDPSRGRGAPVPFSIGTSCPVPMDAITAIMSG